MASCSDYFTLSRNPRSRKIYSAGKQQSKAKDNYPDRVVTKKPRRIVLAPFFPNWRVMRWREWFFRPWMSREEAEQHGGMMACRVKSRCDANPSYACTHPFEPLTLLAHSPAHPENASWRPVLPPGCFLTFLTCSTSNGEGGSRRNSHSC